MKFINNYIIGHKIRYILVNPSSLGIDISVAQRQKEMYKLFGSELFDDEGSPNTFNNFFAVRQLVTCSLNDIYSIIY